MMRRPYENLHVWQLAHQLALDVDECCTRLPASERFELSSQLRRASRSIPANLVEGKGGDSPRVYLRHVQIALGSACELDYHLLFAADRKYVAIEASDELRTRAWAVRGLLLRLAAGLKRQAGG